MVRQLEQTAEQVREREEQLATVQSQLSALQADRASRHSALDSLQGTINEQTRQLEKSVPLSHQFSLFLSEESPFVNVPQAFV